MLIWFEVLHGYKPPEEGRLKETCKVFTTLNLFGGDKRIPSLV
jgi:hypothetical protein